METLYNDIRSLFFAMYHACRDLEFTQAHWCGIIQHFLLKFQALAVRDFNEAPIRYFNTIYRCREHDGEYIHEWCEDPRRPEPKKFQGNPALGTCERNGEMFYIMKLGIMHAPVFGVNCPTGPQAFPLYPFRTMGKKQYYIVMNYAVLQDGTGRQSVEFYPVDGVIHRQGMEAINGNHAG
jgi:hypothetical protein